MLITCFSMKMIGKTLEKLLTLEERKIINYDNIKTKRPEDLDFKFYHFLLLFKYLKNKSICFPNNFISPSFNLEKMYLGLK